MVDVVPNHMGPDMVSGYPFNRPEHFHYPRVNSDPGNSNWPAVVRDTSRLESIWFYGLADLNTENEYVVKTLNSWIKWFVDEYKFDGLRADTARFVRKSFWRPFNDAASTFMARS